MEKYYENEPRFKGVYSRENLPKNKGLVICNKSWWICWYWNSLDYFVWNKQ